MNTMQKQPTAEAIQARFHVLGSFTWEKGSINDNIRKILIDKGINYTNTFNGDVLIDIFNVNMWQKVYHLFTDKDNTNCLVYIK